MNTLIKQKSENGYSVTEIDIVDEEKIAELENSKLVFTPEFIPYYLHEIKKYGFTSMEGLLYGFMRFYLSNNVSGRFYFTNKQLAYMLDSSESTISHSIQKVLLCGEFKCEYKIKSNGGKFRLVKSCKSDMQKVASPISRKLLVNNNNVKHNNENTFNNSLRKKESRVEETKKLLNSKSQYDILKEKNVL